MATVIPYQHNPLLGQLLNIGANYLSDYMTQRRERAEREEYHNSLMDALGVYEKGKQGVTEDVTTQYTPTGMTQEPTGYSFQPNQAMIAQQQVPIANVQGAGYDMQPTGYQSMTRPINEITQQQRPLTDPERSELDERTRGMLEVLGAKVPRTVRIDPYTVIPKQDKEGGIDENGRPIPGAQVWRGFDAETKEPILGLITRSRTKPTTTKYKGKDVIWDIPAGTQGYYATEAGIQGRQVGSALNFQKLWKDFIDDPIPEKEAAAISAARSLGLSPTKQDLSTKEKIKNWFGADIPEYTFVDKNGSYVGIDAEGNAVKLQPKKSSGTDKGEAPDWKIDEYIKKYGEAGAIKRLKAEGYK